MRIPAVIMLFFFILVLLTGCKAAPPELPEGWEMRAIPGQPGQYEYLDEAGRRRCLLTYENGGLLQVECYDELGREISAQYYAPDTGTRLRESETSYSADGAAFLEITYYDVEENVSCRKRWYLDGELYDEGDYDEDGNPMGIYDPPWGFIRPPWENDSE